MPNILTSWKEIGQYLGKGVRTVQRWEREAGLPVRRQVTPSPHSVIAMSDELDTWARSQTRGPGGALAGALQREIAILHAENSELRVRLDALEAALAAKSAVAEPSAHNGHLRTMCLNLEDHSLVLSGCRINPVTGSPGASGDVRSESREIRFAARRGRARAIRARLSFAFTLCVLGEKHVHDGGLAALRKAKHSALEIQRSLESPGHVPPNELADLRSLLRTLVMRIQLIAPAPGKPL
jgi:hypothetical protein